MHTAAQSGQSRFNWPAFVALALASVAFVNAAMYISYAGNPFVTSDGWYFVDAFLQKYYNGGVTLQDLYMKRSADDHAQPIHKLLLIWNADTFSLDFVIESYIGLAIAAAAWLLMLYAAWQDNRNRNTRAWWLLPMVATAASFVSLSGGMVFNWSLVTLSYLGPLAMVGLAMAAWQAIERNQWLPLAVVAPIVMFTMDGTAVICAISTVCALSLREIKLRGKNWQRTAAAIAVVILAAAAYRITSQLYLNPNISAAQPGTAAVSTLLGMGGEQLQRMALKMAALSISDLAPIQRYTPTNAEFIHQLLGAAVVVAHAWFWWRVLRDRWNRTQFIAITLMLFCYGAAAGIVLSRVPVFGPDYVSQQRYLMLYQLGTVAIALMAAGANWEMWRRPQRIVIMAAMAFIVAIQLPLSRSTWAEAPYVQAYGNNLGRQMILLGNDPSVKLASCAPMLVICQASIEEQKRSITLLQARQLNAYSTRMLRRYSMQSLETDAGPAEVILPPAR